MILVENSKYFFIRGLANIIVGSSGSSNTRHLLFTPRRLRYGVTAKTTLPLERDLSATTSGVVKGFNPLKTHSTEA